MKPIAEKEWELPAGFGQDGKVASLRQVIAPEVPTLSLNQLSSDQMAELTVLRIESEPDFDIGMIGAGKITREQAVAEVKAKSPVGRNLIEIERRMLQRLINDANRQMSDPNVAA